MLNKSFTFLAAFVTTFVISTTAWALPKSMIMNTSFTNHAMKQKIKVNAKWWYNNDKIRIEFNSNLNMPKNGSTAKLPTNNGVAIMNLKKKVGYLINDAAKIALKADTSQAAQLNPGMSQTYTDPKTFTDPVKLKAEIKKQGGKVVGKEKLLGYNCTVWSIAPKKPVKVMPNSPHQKVKVKLWLADKISVPLKVETYLNNKKATVFQVKNIKLNVPIKSSLFEVPKGYKVSDLMQMFQSGQ